MNNQHAPLSVDGVSPLKKVAAIHDISCFGRCALTVIIPTLSAMGNQVVPVPTCLLSSHTGGFTDLYFEDLSQSIDKISNHFDRLKLRFDAIYTGFLGSCGQIEQVKAFINTFRENGTLVLVDPVMGDGGKLYSTYTPALVAGISELCRYADVITPNLTEACLLTGTPYVDTSLMNDGEFDSFCRSTCEKLSEFGVKQTVVTGLHRGEDKLCVCGRNNVSGEYFCYEFPRVNKNYPGTGDLFACVLLGAILDGEDIEKAAHRASDFVRRVMEYSAKFNTPEREGVAFEAFLGELAKET